MTEANAEALDYYEILQVNQSADSQTIERVFRLLAKRFHPDNRETGDPDRFNLVVEAFRVLSDPEERVSYDARYERIREHQWQVLDQESAGDDVEADRRIRLGILSLLYTTRRQDVHQPGLGTFELERLLGCPEHHMQFHMWYLKENGWIERMDNGKFAITVSGVDKLVETDIPWRHRQALLPSGSDDSDDDDGDA
jgi:curved DNA-binding protein CbpA